MTLNVQGKLVVNPVAKGVTSRDPSYDHVWQVPVCSPGHCQPVSLISVSGYTGQLELAGYHQRVIIMLRVNNNNNIQI